MTLTRYPLGSFRELISISLPLMISSLSVMAMVFVDRIFLAHYSVEALNAAVTATTFGWSFIAAWMVMTSIAEVFVAQYNGAGAREKLGEPVWQMIWLSLASTLFFLPMAFWVGSYLYEHLSQNRVAMDYFVWMMLFGASYPLYGALCGFFVGQGKTTLITVMAIAANFINIFLDWILIFGVEGWIPAMGTKGAAIATNCSSIFQDIILFAIFLSAANRTNFGTGDFRLKLHAMWQCIRIGFPSAIFAGTELLGWAMFYWMMTKVGEKYITVTGICQSLIILFYFFVEGLNKGAMTIAGNMIGGNRVELVPRVLVAGLKLLTIFTVLLFTLVYVFSDELLLQFLPGSSIDLFNAYYDSLLFGLMSIAGYIFFEGLRMLFAGLLTAAGDTRFLCYAGIFSIWVFLVVPNYLLVVLMGLPVEASSLLCIFYGLASSSIYMWRFYEGKWKSLSIFTTKASR
jgi:multidrug resistance protein, MATE family